MTILVLVASCLLAALGQLLLKWGATGQKTVLAFANPYVVGGLAAYGVSTVLWLYALSVEKLSVVFPFTALTLVLVYAVSFFILKEDLGGRELLGALLILGGLFLVAVR